MDTKPLERFATWARRELINAVDAQATAVLSVGSVARSERAEVVKKLEAEIGRHGRQHVVDKVAYTWFNRIVALRFMDARGYNDAGVVSPAQGRAHGQPEILSDAKRGNLDTDVVANTRTAEAIIGLLDGTRRSTDAEGEAYALLLTEYCRHWHKPMPFMFEREGDYTELLVPANLLADGAILSRARDLLTKDVCNDVEVIGWLYQYYISDRKNEVFDGFKAKGKARKPAGPDEIPAATQLFTPHWIVRYLVENSVGRMWMLNRPTSRLVDHMQYYIAPAAEEPDFLKISKPEELTVIDPACGSGHMLTYAFDLLYSIYEEEGYAPSDIAGLILAHNLHGTEIDSRAGSLAAFSLTMKARAKQRTFFDQKLEPKICVIEPISFEQDELEFLRSKDGVSSTEDKFWNQFEFADVFGALIRPKTAEVTHAATVLSDRSNSGEILHNRTLELATKTVAQAAILSKSYSVVVANPPYMGNKNMGGMLAAYAKEDFPSTKSDLFAMFLDRCLEFLPPGGYAGLMSPFVWMFISTYEPLRKRLISDETITSLVQLEYSGFDGATVPVCAYVLRRGRVAISAAFVRLEDFVGAALQGPKALEIIAADRAHRTGAGTSGLERHLYRLSPLEFASVPGSPIAYWISQAMRSTFSRGKKLGDVADLKVGLQTGDVNQYLRRWWEVSCDRTVFDCVDSGHFSALRARWIPYDKGGDYRKWYGNQQFVLNWEGGGADIRANPSARPQNIEYFFRSHIGMTAVSSGDPAFRLYPTGFAFDNASRGLFMVDPVAQNNVLAFANSNIARALLKVTSPTLNYNVDEIASLPVLGLADSEVSQAVDRLTARARKDLDSYETSWGFTGAAVLTGVPRRPSLERSVAELFSFWAAEVASQHETETATNRLVAERYGLADEVPDIVSASRVSLDRNLEFRYGSGKPSKEYASLQREDAICELISYAVGCIFGRFSLDAPGLVLANQGASLTQYLERIPAPSFHPDADNVIPFVDDGWFEDDIVERFRQFLRAAFGADCFEANLRFVEESLGVNTLRDYFITKAGKSKFYEDHVKRYKSRPIYWMFSSPKGSFNALIYMHRYTPSTVSTVLNEYLREYRAKLEVALSNAEKAAARGGSPKEQKEADRLRKVLVELAEYERDVLYPLAMQQIVIDLDDGVKVNYPKFYPALKSIAGLEASE